MKSKNLTPYTFERVILTFYTFERVIYNGIDGWFATRYIDGVYAGKQFGKTKAKAKAAFTEGE